MQCKQFNASFNEANANFKLNNNVKRNLDYLCCKTIMASKYDTNNKLQTYFLKYFWDEYFSNVGMYGVYVVHQTKFWYIELGNCQYYNTNKIDCFWNFDIVFF